MYTNYLRISWLPFCFALITGCINPEEHRNAAAPLSPEFKDYWYSGKAELTRYRLEQARYGEIHRGDAVLIFVTEDFLTDKQVKFEGREPDDNITSVLKLNFTRKFITGIYPYSVMSSVFTPVENTPSLKLTTSVQEWCGNTYSQLNLGRGGQKYSGQLHSYFMSEADQDFNLQPGFLEDEIWTKIRLDPESLPTGTIDILPGTQFLRFSHHGFKVEKADGFLSTARIDTLSAHELMKYRLEYKDIRRVLEIVFEKTFPFRILAWSEEMQSGFREPKVLTTRGIATHTILLPYWQHHDLEDSVYRKQLGF